MKAYVLVKNAVAEKAFELREMPIPEIKPNEVLIKSEAFGLNFADIMARNGLYRDCPPLPAVIGYENTGTVIEAGNAVTGLSVGDRVIAFTRFGGYADHIVTDEKGAIKLPDNVDAGMATALATQYSTAWFAAEEMTRLYPGDNVLIHAAAGGVGTALIQMAKRHDCTIFGTAGSPEKLEYIREQGVHYPINYRTEDFVKSIEKLGFNKKIDVAFNPIGGDYVKKDYKLLNAGGREVLFGASKMMDAKGNIFKTLGVAKGFGIWSPIEFVTQSKSIIGLNMLRVADNKPEVLQRCLQAVVNLTAKGELKPVVGKTFKAEQLAEAHRYMEERKSIGKIVLFW